MIHIYYGDGKGKTTAACGLAARASGSGMKVLFVQFFKSGASSEVAALQKLGVKTLNPEVHFGRYKLLDEEEKTRVRRCYGGLFTWVVENADGFGLVVLDECLSAYGHGMLDRAGLLDFLDAQGEKREIVLTGRDPAPELLRYAHYATRMEKVKHPFDMGVKARKGIEY